MKASVKFREDRAPLVRAKVPVGVLGLPFVSGVTAVDARELRLDLSTAFRAGPSVRLSYRPNDTINPFSLILKIGVGALGSPSAGSPLSMAAEFGLLGSRPTFSLLLKPRIGDFSFRKSVSAAVPATATDASDAVAVTVAPVGDGHAIDVSAFAGGGAGGIDGLLSGYEISAKSVLPLQNRTTVQFKWGLKVPPELRASFDDPTAAISPNKLPLLVMNKISIERSTDDKKAKEKKPCGITDVNDACVSVKREVEALQVECGLLRSSVDGLRAEIGSRKHAPVASPVVRKRDCRSDGKSLQNTGKSEGTTEELMQPATASTAATAP
ncbi:hypothetical protein MUK42_04880 [Musa troglodytarum]|uniref:Uncharacterized protein n=1 Tax=Musa troglodytarum TaxID=320322 RepID=A0A9E7G9Y8_9LILI|nr:hypothetical protein MUK42_04880 [Musa troglodytarum]